MGYRFAAPVLGAVLGLTAPALGQEQLTIQVSATVVQPITGIAQRNLQFGAIAPGSVHRVNPDETQSTACSSCASGKWLLDRLSNDEEAARYVALTFTRLPAGLTGPSSTLPVSYEAKACLAQSGTRYHCFDSWSPQLDVAHLLQQHGGGVPQAPGTTIRALEIYLGGTVTAAADQAPGRYTGSVTLMFAYSRL
jgi:hypothetical protein